MSPLRQSLSMSVVAAAIIVSAAGPGLGAQDSAAAPKANAVKTGAAPPMVWPAPPETPRIRYIATYTGAEDFKRKKSGSWKTFLFGKEETAPQFPDSLVKPYGVAVAEDGRLYVTDTASRRVFVFDGERKALSFIGERGSGALSKPTGIAVDPKGRIFVADATLNRVFGYAPDGSLAMAVGREGEFENPAGLAIDGRRGLLYVADSTRHQIHCYSIADGSKVRTIGRRGGEQGEFNFPTNLAVDRRGRLYVADTLNFRIQIFEADGSFQGVFGTLGDTPGSLNRPKGIGVDGEGHIYVADTSFNNFQIFDDAGQLLLFVGAAGKGPGEFFLPAGLNVDSRDRIYIVDQGNARVQVFQYLRAPAR